MKTQKMKTKEVITVVLLSLVNIVIFSLGSFLYLTPVTILLMPVFYSLLQGIVYFMIGVKVRKRGAIFLYCVIQGAIAFNLPYLLMHLLAGLIAEILLAKTGYANVKSLTISYVVLQLLACMASTIYPYAISLNSTLENMGDTGDLDVNVQAAGEMIQSWGSLILIAVVLASALIGAWIGWKAVKKHIVNAQQNSVEGNK